MTTPQAIREEDGVHKQWYKDADKMTLEKLPEFLRHLMEDYQHDYGTVCHALAAGAVATCWALNNAPGAQGGITGFQAGAVMWEFLRHWEHVEGPARLIRYEHLLYPQYDYLIQEISQGTWEWLQEEAKKKLAGNRSDMVERVRQHMQSIADGTPPFGLRISERGY